MARIPTTVPRRSSAGVPLISDFAGGESDTIREIPPEFRAACELQVIETPLAEDVDIEPLSDAVLASKAEMKQTSERIRRTTRKQQGPVVLTEVFTDKNKQTGVRTRTMRFEGDPVTPATATADVQTKNLGNKHFIEDFNDSLSVFPETVTKIEIPDLVPQEMRAAAPTTTHEEIITGLIVDPPILQVGDLERTEAQIDSFNKKVTVRGRAGITLPVSLAERDTSRDKQEVTVTRTLQLGVDAQASPTATQDVKIINLGNGTVVQEVRAVPVVFQHNTAKIEIPDLVPVEMRPVVPTTTTSIESAGVASLNPVLGVGDIEKEESQLTVFNKRITTRSRGSIALPVSLASKQLTKEFGGGIVDVVRTLEVVGGSIDEGNRVVDSKITNLGNATEIKETQQLETSSWPTLYGTRPEWQTGLVVPFTQQVVPADTSPISLITPFTETRPLDKWRSITIAPSIPSNLSSLNRTYPATINHIFPDVVTNIVLREAWAFASTPDASAVAYEAAMTYKLTRGYRGPCDGQITEQYTNGPPSSLPLITKFFPQQVQGVVWYTYWDGSPNAIARAFELLVPDSLHSGAYFNAILNASVDFPIVGTTPNFLPASGTFIVVDCVPEPWRFGIYRTKIVKVQVP